jgi:hypothetical protein
MAYQHVEEQDFTYVCETQKTYSERFHVFVVRKFPTGMVHAVMLIRYFITYD